MTSGPADNAEAGTLAPAPPSPSTVSLDASLGLRLEFDALGREYDSLRSEVDARISKQQDITSFAIALLAGSAALTQILPGNPHPGITSSQLRPFYPAISIVFSAFALMTLDHELNIALIYNYIDRELRPQLKKLLRNAGGHTTDCWVWNRMRAYEQHHAGLTTILNSCTAGSKYAMTLLPSVASIALCCYLRQSLVLIPTWETFLLGLAGTLAVLAIVGTAYAGFTYWKMPHRPLPAALGQ